MQAVTKQPIEKLNFFSNSPMPLLATNRWPRSQRTLGIALSHPRPRAHDLLVSACKNRGALGTRMALNLPGFLRLSPSR